MIALENTPLYRQNLLLAGHGRCNGTSGRAVGPGSGQPGGPKGHPLFLTERIDFA